MIKFSEEKVLLLHKLITEETRVGLSIAAGEMKYEELLDWILENEV